jgi:hypothetical protein
VSDTEKKLVAQLAYIIAALAADVGRPDLAAEARRIADEIICCDRA